MSIDLLDRACISVTPGNVLVRTVCNAFLGTVEIVSPRLPRRHLGTREPVKPELPRLMLALPELAARPDHNDELVVLLRVSYIDIVASRRVVELDLHSFFVVHTVVPG